jgi:hypothetical protein
MSSTIVDELKKATAGLLYTSESDEPFEAFLWKDGGGSLTAQHFLDLSGHKPAEGVEEVKLGDFFSELTADQDWYGEAEREAAGKYRRLLQTLGSQLSEIRVFRVGKVDKEIFIVGRTSSGDWAGIKTKCDPSTHRRAFSACAL